MIGARSDEISLDENDLVKNQDEVE